MEPTTSFVGTVETAIKSQPQASFAAKLPLGTRTAIDLLFLLWNTLIMDNQNPNNTPANPIVPQENLVPSPPNASTGQTSTLQAKPPKPPSSYASFMKKYNYILIFFILIFVFIANFGLKISSLFYLIPFILGAGFVFLILHLLKK